MSFVDFETPPHALMGSATLNVGTVRIEQSVQIYSDLIRDWSA